MISKKRFSIDIGTTTVAAVCDDKYISLLNPQSQYGADIITRIVSVSENGIETIRFPLLSAIDCIADSFGVLETDVEISVAANTALCCFLTGKDPTPMASYPFRIDTLFGDFYTVSTEKREYRAYVAPCFSAYVGGDIAVGFVYSGADIENGNILYIDIGTNGEMVIKTDDKLFYAATAAGPAFEGKGISVGMGGVDGAINHIYRNNGGDIVFDVIGDAKTPLGICGSGLIDLLALYLSEGCINEFGSFTDVGNDFPFPMNRSDISQLQLAKSAVISGIECLLYAARLSASDIDKVYIAGTFGSNLNVDSMCGIGMLPREFVNKTVLLGNASLFGASKLFDTKFRTRCEEAVKRGKCIPLSGNKFFEKRFMDNLMFDIV